MRSEVSLFEVEWARCARWIEAALEMAHGTHDLADVKARVEAGDARFWAGRNAAMVTTQQDYPKLKSFTFWLAGGDLDELRDELRPMAEAHYRARGCTYATIYGRRGWVKALANEGYHEIHTTVAKELTP